MPEFDPVNLLLLKGINPKLHGFITSEKGGGFLDTLENSLKKTFGTDNKDQIADPEVFSNLERFQKTLMADKSGVFIDRLSQELDRNPNFSQDLASVIEESPEGAKKLLSAAVSDPTLILNPRANLSPASAQVAQSQPDSVFDARFQARTGYSAPSSVAAGAGAAGAAAGAANTTGGAGGFDLSTLGGGLSDMFQNFQKFLSEDLPKLLEVFTQFIGQIFSGLKGGGAISMAGNKGQEGPGMALSEMAGVNGARVSYQLEDAEPVAMVTRPSTAPSARGAAPAPASSLDRDLNPRLEPTPQTV